MRKFLRADAIIITIQIFIFVWLFTLIPLNLGFLDPVGQSLRDFDIYDVVFSRLRAEPVFDDRIVLVNIGSLNRRGIAELIKIISRSKPEVIGLDALFLSEKDASGDSALAAAFSECRNLVLVSRLAGYSEDRDEYESDSCSIRKFSRYAFNNYANMPENENGGYRTVRVFRPSVIADGKTEVSFAVRVAQLADSTKTNEFLQRDNELEIINYRGNLNKFYSLDFDQVLDEFSDVSFLKSRIVLLGYMGEKISEPSLTDVFFTPLNERYAGRTFPDMYGIVIHANIVSMILSRTYIDQMPRFFSLLLAFLFTYINAIILLWVKRNMKDWFGGLTKIILFLQAVFNLLLGLLAFAYMNYKINLTLALVAIFLVPTSMDIYLNYIEKIYIHMRKKFKLKTKV